jgi:methylamine dehydrogenase accessory protein MauD
VDAALLVACLLLALVFALAGVAKLADQAGSRQAIVDFGLPRTLATPLGIMLPLCELVVAAALILTATAWWGAIGALALLLLFIGGISINLARGHKPDCHCFGQLHSAPAGWSTLIRNGLLAAVAGFVVWEGKDRAGPSAVAWLGSLSTAQLVALVMGLVVVGLLAAQWWFLVHLLRQNGRLLMRLEALEESVAQGGGAAPSGNGLSASGLAVGTQAPPFSLSGLYGETLTLEALLSHEKPVMLMFTDPDCGPCNTLLPEIGRWQLEYSEKLTVALISRGEPEENRTKTSEHGVQHVLLQGDWEVAEAYQIKGTPSAVLVMADGKVGSSVASGEEAIRSIVGHVVRPQAPIPVTKKVGDAAPEVKLPDLEGDTVELSDFKGQKTLALFWNPGCGFCQQMLPNLKEWEENPPEGAPNLLVISSGTKEANEAMGLSSPVVLDQQFSVGRAFGVSGTPSAVLVDAEGKIASEVAVGAQAVLELAGAHQGQA